MNLRNARSAVKAETLRTHNKLVSWLFLFSTLLMLSSVIRMWSHWFESQPRSAFIRPRAPLQRSREPR